MDGAATLWSELMRELVSDENDFKHRIAVMDSVVKRGDTLDWIASLEADTWARCPQAVPEGRSWQSHADAVSTPTLPASTPASPVSTPTHADAEEDEDA